MVEMALATIVLCQPARFVLLTRDIDFAGPFWTATFTLRLEENEYPTNVVLRKLYSELNLLGDGGLFNSDIHTQHYIDLAGVYKTSDYNIHHVIVKVKSSWEFSLPKYLRVKTVPFEKVLDCDGLCHLSRKAFGGLIENGGKGVLVG